MEIENCSGSHMQFEFDEIGIVTVVYYFYDNIEGAWQSLVYVLYSILGGAASSSSQCYEFEQLIFDIFAIIGFNASQ